MAIRPAEQLIHKAAWLYYAHGLRQDQVASQLNISRASVAMYLRKARETGIVNISTSTQLFTDDVMARQLEDALEPRRGLDRAGKRLCHRSVDRHRGAGGERLSRTGQEGRPHRRRLGPNHLHHRRHHVLCRPAGRHGGAALRQSRRALLLPARPVHDGNRAPAQRQGAEFLRAAGADDGSAGAWPARRAGDPRAIVRDQRLRSRALFGRHSRCRQPCRQMRRAERRRDGFAARGGCGRRHRRADHRCRRQGARLQLQPPRHLGGAVVAAPDRKAPDGGAGGQQVRTAARGPRRRALHASRGRRAHGEAAAGPCRAAATEKAS